MQKAKSITLIVAVVGGVFLLGFLFVMLGVRKSLEKADWQGLGELVKGPLGEALSASAVKELPRTSRQPSASAKVPLGWANVSPEKIREGARKMDTYVAAVQVGNAAMNLSDQGESLPLTSAALTGVDPRRRLDAWGHPFCLSEVSHRVAVISLGSSLQTFSGCSEVGISRKDLASLPPGKLYQYPSGALVFVAVRK